MVVVMFVKRRCPGAVRERKQQLRKKPPLGRELPQREKQQLRKKPQEGEDNPRA